MIGKRRKVLLNMLWKWNRHSCCRSTNLLMLLLSVTEAFASDDRMPIQEQGLKWERQVRNVCNKTNLINNRTNLISNRTNSINIDSRTSLPDLSSGFPPVATSPPPTHLAPPCPGPGMWPVLRYHTPQCSHECVFDTIQLHITEPDYVRR